MFAFSSKLIFTLLRLIPSVLFAASSQIDSQLWQVYSHIIFFYLNAIWIYGFFKNHSRRGKLHNVNLSNLENILQRNLRTHRAGKCIFWASGGTNFENISAQHQPWWQLHGFDVCTGLPQKSLPVYFWLQWRQSQCLTEST